MNIREVWAILGEEERSDPGWLFRRVYPNASVDIKAALSLPNKIPALWLELSSSIVSRVVEFPKTLGFEVKPEPIVPGPDGKVRLCLLPNYMDDKFRDIFSKLAQDVADTVSEAGSEQEALNIFLARLNVWQSFMQKYKPDGLSLSEQIGLFSELYIFNEYLVNQMPAFTVVNCWNGPDGGIQDFNFPNCAVEIKGTTSTRSSSIQISSLLQLDETRVPELMMCVVFLDSGQVNGVTLPGIVQEIGDFISEQDVTALALFHDKLLQYGYVTLQAELYGKTFYRVREVKFYSIRDDFPRLRQSDVNVGIDSCHYSVQLSACDAYKIHPDEVNDKLFGNLYERRA